MRLSSIESIASVLVLVASVADASAVELPAHYFQLMQAEVKSLDPADLKPHARAPCSRRRSSTRKQHPTNSCLC